MPNLRERIHGFIHPSPQSPYSPSSNFQDYLSVFDTNFEKWYIKNRILDQIDWYNKKAVQAQSDFKHWSVASIVLSAIIPILTLLSDMLSCRGINILIAIISSGVTVISAILSLYHFQDLWVRYRSNCEILQSILHRYLTRTGEFQNLSVSEAFNILVVSCEEYMTKEFQTWVAANAPRSQSQNSTSDSSHNS